MAKTLAPMSLHTTTIATTILSFGFRLCMKLIGRMPAGSMRNEDVLLGPNVIPISVAAQRY